MHSIFINTDAALEVLCERLAEQPVLALDTEFMREKTYFAQLCLLQVSDAYGIACVDPLALKDISPLLAILYDPSKTKVLHSARQDLEVLYDIRHELPENLFDTQIAAMFLGYGEQIGYAPLVHEQLGVLLSKSQTRTDWSRRPLDTHQLDYAADDVRYLLPLSQKLGQQLELRNRLSWFQEESLALSSISMMNREGENLWQRVKSWQSLRGQALAFLQQLAQWREAEAVSSNRPRRWILDDAVLLALAERQPKARDALAALMPAKAMERYADTLLVLLAEARELAPALWPQPPTVGELTGSQKARFKLLQLKIQEIAEREGIPPSLLAKRRDLERLARGDTPPTLQTGWRSDLFAEVLMAVPR